MKKKKIKPRSKLHILARKKSSAGPHGKTFKAVRRQIKSQSTFPEQEN